MNNKYKWIIFDLGGVLLDWRYSLKEMATILGISYDRLYSHFLPNTPRIELGEVKEADFWQETLNSFNPNADFGEIYTSWINHPMIMETWEFAKELKGKGNNLAVASNIGTGKLDLHRQMIKDFEIFSRFFDSSVLGVRKPDTKFYRTIEEKLQVNGEEIFFIDDVKVNIEGATKEGWNTFHFDSDRYTYQQLSANLRQILL